MAVTTTAAMIVTGTHSVTERAEGRLEVTGNVPTAQGRLATGREGTRENPEAMEILEAKTTPELGASVITITVERSAVTRREEGTATVAEAITVTVVFMAVVVSTAAEAVLTASLNNS